MTFVSDLYIKFHVSPWAGTEEAISVMLSGLGGFVSSHCPCQSQQYYSTECSYELRYEEEGRFPLTVLHCPGTWHVEAVW